MAKYEGNRDGEGCHRHLLIQQTDHSPIVQRVSIFTSCLMDVRLIGDPLLMPHEARRKYPKASHAHRICPILITKQTPKTFRNIPIISYPIFMS